MNSARNLGDQRELLCLLKVETMRDFSTIQKPLINNFIYSFPLFVRKFVPYRSGKGLITRESCFSIILRWNSSRDTVKVTWITGGNRRGQIAHTPQPPNFRVSIYLFWWLRWISGKLLGYIIKRLCCLRSVASTNSYISSGLFVYFPFISPTQIRNLLSPEKYPPFALK